VWRPRSPLAHAHTCDEAVLPSEAAEVDEEGVIACSLWCVFACERRRRPLRHGCKRRMLATCCSILRPCVSMRSPKRRFEARKGRGTFRLLGRCLPSLSPGPSQSTMAPVGKLYVTVESASVSKQEAASWAKLQIASLKGAPDACAIMQRGTPNWTHALQRRGRAARNVTPRRGQSVYLPLELVVALTHAASSPRYQWRSATAAVYKRCARALRLASLLPPVGAGARPTRLP
jgi:hypothetical protein